MCLCFCVEFMYSLHLLEGDCVGTAGYCRFWKKLTLCHFHLHRWSIQGPGQRFHGAVILELLKGLASHQNWITVCNFTRSGLIQLHYRVCETEDLSVDVGLLVFNSVIVYWLPGKYESEGICVSGKALVQGMKLHCPLSLTAKKGCGIGHPTVFCWWFT